MIKLKIKRRITNKTFMICGLCSLLVCLLLSSYCVYKYVKTKNFVKVEATIIENENSEKSPHNSINIDYKYKNVNYTNQLKVIFKFNKKVGKTVQIHLNPANPYELRDAYVMYLLPITAGLIGVYSIFCLKVILTRKKIH